MSEAGTARQESAGKGYFATSYALGTGTTHTPALMVWRALNSHLLDKGLPMTGEELVKVTALPLPYIEGMFVQTYYQKSYGFRRFSSLDEWRAWAGETGLVYTAPADDEEDDEPSEA